MVDTHAHLALCEPADEELVEAARAVGVNRILTVGIDDPSNRQAIAAANEHEGVFAAIGRHPNSAGGFDDEAAEDIERLAGEQGVRAIGETGLDFYRDSASRDDQRRAFRDQIEIARRVRLPVVIHLRDRDGVSQQEGAVGEAFSVLEREAGGVAVILHCFSATERVADAAAQGWYCSFAGNATFPAATALRSAAAEVPDDLLLVETDAPFLSPQPMRGKPNAPANVVHTATAIAEARGVTYEQLEGLVQENAKRVLSW